MRVGPALAGPTHPARGVHDDWRDSLGGVSDFKRTFSTVVAHVADEWLYEPVTLRARLARVAHRAIGQMKRGATHKPE